ncbi:MAG: hypothetical protein OET79_05850 [Nitrospirota bacterium]|nr:hypothetical protein [Nitrospirota bacterium]
MAKQSPRLSGRPEDRRFELRVRPPQAAEKRLQTRTQFSRPLIQCPLPHVEQPRLPSSPAAHRPPPAVG